MAELMTISEFAKQNANQGKKHSTPQKINYAIRNQGAPVDQSTGKRKIDPDAWDEWLESTGSQKKEAKAQGKPVDGNAERIRRKAGIEQGSFLAWKSGRDNDMINAGQVNNPNQHYAGTNIDEESIESPLKWESIEEYIRNGDMMVVNRPSELIYVLAQHYKREGDQETYNILNDLYEQKKEVQKRI